jgi:hypothetical protein
MFIKLAKRNFSKINLNTGNNKSLYKFKKIAEEEEKAQPMLLEILAYGYPESRCSLFIFIFILISNKI